MKNYINLLNKKLVELIKDINESEEEVLKNITDEKQKRKIQCVTMYYKSVLNGCGLYVTNVMDTLQEIKMQDEDKLSNSQNTNEMGLSTFEVKEVTNEFEFSMEQFMKNYKRNPKSSNSEVYIELEENPSIDLDISEVDEGINLPEIELDPGEIAKVTVSDALIELEENPEIDMEVAYVTDEDDIELEENPEIDMEVAYVTDEDDIELEENPKIDMKVAEVTDEDDIELEENPEIDIKVAEVTDEDDIELEENPEIDMEVAEVTDEDDIVLEENPNIDIEVDEVEDTDLFEEENK